MNCCRIYTVINVLNDFERIISDRIVSRERSIEMDIVILERICQIINLNIESGELSINQIDEDLFSIGMSSIDYIRIVVALEEEFECQIPNSKLLLSEMNTMSKIYQVIVQCVR